MQTSETALPNDDHEEILYRPAQLAATLFFHLLDDTIRDQHSTVLRRKLTDDLKLALTGKADTIWHMAAPMAYLWICLTGAAASDNSRERGWFIFRQRSMARALKVDDSSLIQETSSYFYWLRQSGSKRLIKG
jgi:hypothetical protein